MPQWWLWNIPIDLVLFVGGWWLGRRTRRLVARRGRLRQVQRSTGPHSVQIQIGDTPIQKTTDRTERECRG